MSIRGVATDCMLIGLSARSCFMLFELSFLLFRACEEPVLSVAINVCKKIKIQKNNAM